MPGAEIVLQVNKNKIMGENRGGENASPLNTVNEIAEKEVKQFTPELINSDLITEITSELGITDPSLVQELIDELNSISFKSVPALKTPKGILMEYETSVFQKVAIKSLGGSDNYYEAIEPTLSYDEEKKLGLVKKVFDKFVGAEDAVVASDLASKSKYLRDKFEEISSLYNLKHKADEKERIFYFLERDFLKYGKIDVLMNDKHIEDISCNGPNMPLYVYHREYGSIRTNISFEERELNEFILRLSQLCGKHISILNPIMDAALPDGSRINMTLGSEVTKKGSTFTIRKFKKVPISPIELMNYGSVDSRMLAYLWIIMDYGRSYLVSGGTASGKTTLLNAVCMFIKPQYKIVSIEDTPEINLQHPNWLQAVSRTGFGSKSTSPAGGGVLPSGISPTVSSGNIGLYDLLVAALRQRPEYIIVGEVRGAEAFTMFQAIAVGHACMGTIHARNMTELVGRVETVPMNVPRTLFSNVDLVVFVSQIKAGDKIMRRVIEVVEVLELEPTTKALITNQAFRWDPKTDKFESSHFMLFDKIAEEFGITRKSLMEEYERRALFLEGLKAEGIRDHVEVTKKIAEYSAGKTGLQHKITGGE